MGSYCTIFLTSVIEIFHSKKAFLSKMVLFLSFLNNTTNEIQIHNNYVLDRIRTAHRI